MRSILVVIGAGSIGQAIAAHGSIVPDGMAAEPG